MSATTEVFANVSELEIFSLVAGGVSVLAVVLLTFAVIQLSMSINKLKRQVEMQARVDLHLFHNQAIQPEEELAKRGYSMYNGQQQPDKPPDMPENEQHFGSFDSSPRQLY